MNRAIIDKLKGDKRITALIKNVSAFSSDEAESLVYKFVPIGCDRIINQERLEITIISKDIDTIDTVTNAIKDDLLTFGDSGFNNIILGIELNGGGCLENISSGTIHQTLYFNIVEKYKTGGLNIWNVM